MHTRTTTLLVCCLGACMSTLVQGFVPRLALVGKQSKAMGLAHCYGGFFRLPVIPPWSPIPNNGYVVVAENVHDLGYYLDEQIRVVDVDRFEVENKDGNYFISWVLQTQT